MQNIFHTKYVFFAFRRDKLDKYISLESTMARYYKFSSDDIVARVIQKPICTTVPVGYGIIISHSSELLSDS